MLSLYESTTIHNPGTFDEVKKYWSELKLWPIEDGRVAEISIGSYTNKIRAAVSGVRKRWYACEMVIHEAP